MPPPTPLRSRQPITHPPTVDSEFPFSTLLRATDRERLIIPLVTAVWDSIPGLPLLHRDGPEGLDAGPAPEPLMLGAVSITGAWEGTVAMTYPPPLAHDCAARMRGRAAAALTPAEVRDGWGELVNMVGGSL